LVRSCFFYIRLYRDKKVKKHQTNTVYVHGLSHPLCEKNRTDIRKYDYISRVFAIPVRITGTENQVLGVVTRIGYPEESDFFLIEKRDSFG